MEIQLWQVLLGFGGVLVPIILAVMARDRSMITMITRAETTASDAATIAAKVSNERIDRVRDEVHERVNRVRDEYVRRDDMDQHLKRIDKSMDQLRDQMTAGFSDLKQLLGMNHDKP